MTSHLDTDIWFSFLSHGRNNYDQNAILILTTGSLARHVDGWQRSTVQEIYLYVLIHQLRASSYQAQPSTQTSPGFITQSAFVRVTRSGPLYVQNQCRHAHMDLGHH